MFTDEGTAGTVDGSDTVLRVQQNFGNDIAISVGGSSYVRYAATGFLADCGADCAAGGSDLALAHQIAIEPSWQSRLLATLLPGRAAHAAGDNNGNNNGSPSGGGSGNDGGADGSMVSTSFTFCDGRSGETGRAISVAPSGRVSTTTVTCP